MISDWTTRNKAATSVDGHRFLNNRNGSIINIMHVIKLIFKRNNATSIHQVHYPAVIIIYNPLVKRILKQWARIVDIFYISSIKTGLFYSGNIKNRIIVYFWILSKITPYRKLTHSLVQNYMGACSNHKWYPNFYRRNSMDDNKPHQNIYWHKNKCCITWIYKIIELMLHKLTSLTGRQIVLNDHQHNY